MKQKKNKNTIAWIMLFVLVVIALALTYIRFFFVDNDNNNIEERPINNSSSIAIHNALSDITSNFNGNPQINEYADNNINIKATVNNYSIYISYVTDTTTTYEFTYNDLCLNITIDNQDKENQDKFNIIYKLLIEAVQTRINNTDNIDELISNFLTTDTNYDGLSKKEVENGIEYRMNITKKLKIN